jgi:hypothetical protein
MTVLPSIDFVFDSYNGSVAWAVGTDFPSFLAKPDK